MPFLMANLDDLDDCKRALRHLRRRVHKMESEGQCGPRNVDEDRGCDDNGPRGRRRGDEMEEGGQGPGQKGPGQKGPRQKGPGQKGPRRKGAGRKGRRAGGPDGPKVTLKQKLERIRRRGVWRFLAQIAQLSDEPRSLAELDADLDLPRNKMRSTKAIFAKLERRLDVQFLVVDEDGGQDESGNPRYVMPKRIRKQIQKLID